MRPLLFRFALCSLLALGLGACGGGSLAPIDSRDSGGAGAVQARPPKDSPGQYTVRRGDTLYGIAFRHGLDYRDLAAWNGISDVHSIHAGSRLRLTPPPGGAKRERSARPERPAAPALGGPAVAAKRNDSGARPAGPAAGSGSLRWQWPTRGRVVRGDSLLAKNGLNIAGDFGQPVLAAAPGEVVYSGSGLIGYGRLIIVKHDEIYLSAYANNSRLVVAEGDRVRAGQKIAEMGASSRDQVMLHFEIRRNGQPVDPLRYLPSKP